MLVMGMSGPATGHPPSTEVTTEAPVREDDRPKESRLNNQQTEIYLSESHLSSPPIISVSLYDVVVVNCIWSYMNCSSDPQRGESQCRQTFSQCSDQITQEDQWKGLPSVPGLDLQSLSQSESGGWAGQADIHF